MINYHYRPKKFQTKLGHIDVGDEFWRGKIVDYYLKVFDQFKLTSHKFIADQWSRKVKYDRLDDVCFWWEWHSIKVENK